MHGVAFKHSQTPAKPSRARLGFISDLEQQLPALLSTRTDLLGVTFQDVLSGRFYGDVIDDEPKV